MARKRPMTRLDHLAEALECAEKASRSLRNIDLRTVNGERREAVKSARGRAEELGEAVALAMRSDLPVR